MIPIPEGLLEQIERGNVLLFIGERIGRDAEGQVLVDRLAAQLAARCHSIEHPEEYAFPEAAQAYADEWDRQALIQFLRDQLEALGDQPQQVHHLIAGLRDCKVLVTTCVDRRLEQAFAEAGRPLDVIIGNKDVPFVDERKAQLYKLRGSVERVESLVLTEGDYETFFEDQASISVVLQGYLARKTVLFLGYDLADPFFKQLYRKVIAHLDDYARRAYAFGEMPTRKVAGWCKRNGIELVEVRATAFLQELTEKLAKRARPETGSSPQQVELIGRSLPERPYKHLDYYEARDAAIFFGREQETQTLTSLIHAHRLVLLYGASGTGKTSLLLAGVLPRLEQAEPPYETLHVRALEDPAQVIRRTLQRRLPEVALPQAGALVDCLNAATKALSRPLVIFLDQFEEFFIRWNPGFRQGFIGELAELYEARDVPIKLVFSLREDWLAAMSEIEGRVPEVSRIKKRLLPLSREQACRAITSPVQQREMGYDPALVERLLDDLADDQAGKQIDREKAVVMPPQLQLVCDALYERACAEGRQNITLADYETVGQAQGILGRYLEQELGYFPPEERQIAKKVLTALVTSEATKTPTDLPTLAADVEAEEAVVGQVLSRLTRQRLVRRLDGGQTYELAHDILAASIAGWINEDDRQLKRARELLRRELADWQQDPAVFLSYGKFQRLNAVRNDLRFTGTEAAFLLRAAILYNLDVSYWLEKVNDPEIEIRILLEMLQNEAAQTRLTAAKYLAGFRQAEVATALASSALEDTELMVREMAAVSLGQMEDPTGLQRLLDTAQASEGTQRSQAVHALALIQEAVPYSLADMSRQMRRQVYYELVKLRFWRNWPRIGKVTTAGAIGGAVGIGLGVGTLLSLNLVVNQSPWAAVMDRFLYFLVSAILGLLLGAALTFGINVGEVLLRERAGLGRIAGGVLLGGVSFSVLLLILGSGSGFRELLRDIVGGGVFGVMIALGITMSSVISPERGVMLEWGAVGGALGLVIWSYLGFAPGQDVFAPGQDVFKAVLRAVILLGCGGLVGLSMAFSIAWAQARWPIALNKNLLPPAH